jgi:acetyltransferase-like isoleucine patch superfamily enzyme
MLFPRRVALAPATDGRAMKSMAHYRSRLREKDFYDYFNFAHAQAARLKGMLWYGRVFGQFGKRSWLKKPDLIYGPGKVFIGDDVRIEAGAVLYAVKRYGDSTHGGYIRIGQGSFANRLFNATSAFGIDIGERVVFGPNVFLCDFDHGFSEPGQDRLASSLVSKGPIRIGDRCWIGANSFVSSGVTLGPDCVVGANSVVTRSFPAFTVIGGAPAKAIRTFDPASGHWQRVETDAL